MRELLRCPRCRSELGGALESLVCVNRECGLGGGEAFTSVAGQPVLVDFERSILERNSFLSREGTSPINRRKRRGRLRARMKGENRQARRISSDMLSRLGNISAPRILVIGGGAIGSGAEALYESDHIELIGTDIYATSNTKLICDGHALPFPDGAFDAVWIQAVLEHVLSPDTVVSEIYRVLKEGGLVFADTPFMQQVHEGAYDFTRFTLSGHRWLFRQFELISAGVSGGAGSALRWSLRYFIRAVTGSRKAGNLTSALFFWLRFFDGMGQLQEDAAAGVHFYGWKTSHVMRPQEIVCFYVDRAQEREEVSDGSSEPQRLSEKVEHTEP